MCITQEKDNANQLITGYSSPPARAAVAGAGAFVVAAAQPAPTHLLAGRAVAVAAAALAGVAAAGAHVGALALAAHVWGAAESAGHISTERLRHIIIKSPIQPETHVIQDSNIAC